MEAKVILLESASELSNRLQTDLEQEGFEVIPVSVNSMNQACVIEELVLRMKSIDREKYKEKSCVISHTVFIPKEHLVRYRDREIQLRKNENILLKMLYDKRNRVVSKQELSAEIWNEADPKMKEHSLNNLIYSIREKLMRDPGIELKTIPKEGYKLSF